MNLRTSSRRVAADYLLSDTLKAMAKLVSSMLHKRVPHYGPWTVGYGLTGRAHIKGPYLSVRGAYSRGVDDWFWFVFDPEATDWDRGLHVPAPGTTPMHEGGPARQVKYTAMGVALGFCTMAEYRFRNVGGTALHVAAAGDPKVDAALARWAADNLGEAQRAFVEGDYPSLVTALEGFLLDLGSAARTLKGLRDERKAVSWSEMEMGVWCRNHLNPGGSYKTFEDEAVPVLGREFLALEKALDQGNLRAQVLAGRALDARCVAVVEQIAKHIDTAHAMVWWAKELRDRPDQDGYRRKLASALAEWARVG